MFLRAYKPADKRQMQQLFYDTVHTVNARDYTQEQLDAWAPALPNRDAWARLEKQFCFVVESQKEVVGFISLTSDGLLDLLYVHTDFQGKGIARTLLKYVERVARKHGIRLLRTEASITSLVFFEKMGFVLVAEKTKVLGETAFPYYSMEKRLVAAVYDPKSDDRVWHRRPEAGAEDR